MATAILSVGLYLAGRETLSRIALALASAAWLALAADFALRLVRDRQRWARDAGTPAGLTAVAATTVLGVRFSALGWQTVAQALLALAAVLWPVLLAAVVRHWRRRSTGAVFLVCVATQGLSVLGSAVASAEGWDWLAHAAMVLFWLGLALYVIACTRFDAREVTRGAGDHWIAGGALGISALAGSALVAAHGVNPYLWNDDDQGALRATTTVLVTLALAGFCVLLVAEAVRPRPRYALERWGTVFPMGMTAVAALSVSAALGVSWLKGLGEVLLWISVAAWVVVAAGAVRDARGPDAGAAR